MQDFKFQSYVEFFEYLPPEQQLITSSLREIIFDVIPDVKEKLSWNVPFFYKNKNICYIWPGAVPWGKKTYEHVTLGFAKAHKMPSSNYLEMADRKKVGFRKFYSVDQLEDELDEIVKHLIQADEADRGFKQ